jgi:hypothetical protein
MKDFEDRMYQIKVVDHEGQYRRVHVLAWSYQQADNKARFISTCESISFDKFVKKYSYLKESIATPITFENLHRPILIKIFMEALLRVFYMDNRIDDPEHTIDLILKYSTLIILKRAKDKW